MCKFMHLECNLWKFPDDSKLGADANTPLRSAVIQKDLYRLEK